MVTISLSVFFFFLYFIGIGFLLPNKLIRPDNCFNDLINSFWSGLSISIASLQIWHFFWPITSVTWAILLGVSLTGWVLNFKLVLKWLNTFTLRRILTVLVIMGVALLVLSNQAIWGEYHFDHGLYHMQTVKWIQNYAIVPGLGNLHYRLAFNNSSMLYAALLNTTIFHGMAFYIANTLLVFAVLMRCCNSLFRLVENRNKLNLVDLFYVLLGPFLLWHITNSYFTGYSPDFFISILQIILSCELIALFTCPGASQPEQNSTITRIMLLGGLSITVKLSGIVFTIGILISALLFYFFNASPSSHKIKSFLNWMGLLALFVIPWVTRSIILSGYPFFPSPFLSFNVPWKIPKEVVNPISHIVYTWAKYGSNNPTDIPFSEWIGTWLKRIPFEIKECFIFMIILLFFIALLHLFGHHNKRQSESLRVFWIITVVSFASLVFWYLMAPDPRFIGMTIWLVMNSILVILVLQLMDLRIFNSLNLLAAIVIILELLWLAPRFTKQISRSFIISPKLETTIAEQNVSKIPQPFQITASGLKVYLPKDASKEACWDAPLPCTRANDFFLGLSLIDPNNMQKGFYTLPSTYN